MKYKLLNVWLAEKAIKKKDFAQMIGTSQSQVSHWIKNDFKIVDDEMGALELVKVARRLGYE